MKSFVALLISTALLASCSSTGGVKTPAATVLGPTSLLGKQAIASYKRTVTTPTMTMTEEITGYNTQNPDPSLTKAVKDTVLIGGAISAGKELIAPVANGAGNLINSIQP